MKQTIIPFISLLFFMLGCESDKKLDGNWIPKYGTLPTLIIKDKSIIISNNSEIIECNYIFKNSELILVDSTGKKIKNSLNPFKIKNKYSDSLIASFTVMDSDFDFVLVNKKMSSTKFDKIRLEYRNGWNFGSITEIDRNRNVKMWEENTNKNEKKYGTEIIDAKTLDKIIPFANYLYNNNNITLDYSSCSDCQSYFLILQRNDSIKTFTFKGSVNSILPLITLPILNFAKKAKKHKIDLYTKLPFNENKE
jgi:hypothetical protein